MASTPVSSWSDSTVFQYKLVRWDHQLLNTHGYQVTAYEQARVQFTRLNKGSREETKKVVTAAYLAEKRKLLVKLLELRAAAGQSMRQDTRIAATAIAASNAAAENLRVAMAKETARSHRKMQRLLVEQGEHLEDIGEVGKMLVLTKQASPQLLMRHRLTPMTRSSSSSRLTLTSWTTVCPLPAPPTAPHRRCQQQRRQGPGRRQRLRQRLRRRTSPSAQCATSP